MLLLPCCHTALRTCQGQFHHVFRALERLSFLGWPYRVSAFGALHHIQASNKQSVVCHLWHPNLLVWRAFWSFPFSQERPAACEEPRVKDWISIVGLMEEGKRNRQAQHQLRQAVRKQGQLKHRQALQQQRYSMLMLNLAPWTAGSAYYFREPLASLASRSVNTEKLQGWESHQCSWWGCDCCSGIMGAVIVVRE